MLDTETSIDLLASKEQIGINVEDKYSLFVIISLA